MAERTVNFSDPIQKAKVLTHFRQLEGMHRLTIVRQRPRRSDAQNKYMWGVVIPYVAAGLQEAWGESLTADETHEFLKSRFLRKPVVNRNTGEEMGQTVPSSAKLDTAQFIDYIENIAKFAAESLGVAIPAPGQDVRETPVEKILRTMPSKVAGLLPAPPTERSQRAFEAAREAVANKG